MSSVARSTSLPFLKYRSSFLKKTSTFRATLYLQKHGVSLPLERYQPVTRPQRSVPASRAPAGRPPTFGRNLSAASAAISTSIIDESVPIPASPPSFSGYPDVDKHGTADYYRNLIYEHYADVFVDKLPAQLLLARCQSWDSRQDRKAMDDTTLASPVTS